MLETNALQDRLLSVPNFNSAEQRQEYLRKIFTGEEPFPLTNGGMGIGFTDEDFAIAMLKAGAMPTITASAPGYKILRPGFKIEGKELHEYGMAERKRIWYEHNTSGLDQIIATIREQYPHGIIGANLMKILDHYSLTLEDIIRNGGIDILYVGAGLANDLPERMAQDDAKNMYYVPIVSSILAVTSILRTAKQTGGRYPDAFYVELPNKAGGHVASSRQKPGKPPIPNEFDPKTLEEGIREKLKKWGAPNVNIPIIIAGGVAFKDQIENIHSIGCEFAMATPLLLSQESGMPNETIRDFYLNSDIGVVKTKESPTGYESRRLITDYTERNTESISLNTRRCIQCVMPGCKYMEGANDLEDKHYCIANDLSRARFGLPNSIKFVGTGIHELRASGIWEKDGQLYVPKLRHILHKLFVTNTPEGYTLVT